MTDYIGCIHHTSPYVWKAQDENKDISTKGNDMCRMDTSSTISMEDKNRCMMHAKPYP